jgi:hypothetical protein
MSDSKQKGLPEGRSSHDSIYNVDTNSRSKASAGARQIQNDRS